MLSTNAEGKTNYKQWTIFGLRLSKDDGGAAGESCERGIVSGKGRKYFNADGESILEKYDVNVFKVGW